MMIQNLSTRAKAITVKASCYKRIHNFKMATNTEYEAPGCLDMDIINVDQVDSNWNKDCESIRSRKRSMISTQSTVLVAGHLEITVKCFGT